MIEIKSLLQKHKLTYLLPVGLLLGLLAQWLFIGHPLGISWLLFVVAFLIVLTITGRRTGLRPAYPLWYCFPLLFFAAMVVLRANPFLTFLNIITTLGLLAYCLYFYAAGSVRDLSLVGIIILPWRMIGLALGHTGATAAVAIEQYGRPHNRQQQFIPVLRGGALALPIIITFTALLASADLVFNAYLQRLVGLDLPSIMPYVGRGLFVILIATMATGGLATAVIRGLRQKQSDESWLEKTARQLPLHISLNAVETSTIMLLVSGLFLTFLILQFRYLFGGQTNINQEGFTYAEYARRGFFELILVASLSLALIIILNWLTRRETKRQLKLFNLLSTLLIGLVLLLLVAAFWRMRLYQHSYGYSELRIIVLVFELWLGVLLVWFSITLWRAPENFAAGILLVALGFLATLNLINPDALIVHHNLERYRQMGDLDMVYLTGLSADAVPELVNAWSLVKEDDQLVDLPYCYESDCKATLPELLDKNLRARYDISLQDRPLLLGRSYHYARFRANQALACHYTPRDTAVYFGFFKYNCS